MKKPQLIIKINPNTRILEMLLYHFWKLCYTANPVKYPCVHKKGRYNTAPSTSIEKSSGVLVKGELLFATPTPTSPMNRKTKIIKMFIVNSSFYSHLRILSVSLPAVLPRRRQGAMWTVARSDAQHAIVTVTEPFY